MRYCSGKRVFFKTPGWEHNSGQDERCDSRTGLASAHQENRSAAPFPALRQNISDVWGCRGLNSELMITHNTLLSPLPAGQRGPASPNDCGQAGTGHGGFRYFTAASKIETPQPEGFWKHQASHKSPDISLLETTALTSAALPVPRSFSST